MKTKCEQKGGHAWKFQGVVAGKRVSRCLVCDKRLVEYKRDK